MIWCLIWNTLSQSWLFIFHFNIHYYLSILALYCITGGQSHSMSVSKVFASSLDSHVVRSYFWDTRFTYHKMHFHGTVDLKKVGLWTCFLLQEPQDTRNWESKVMYSLMIVHSSWCSSCVRWEQFEEYFYIWCNMGAAWHISINICSDTLCLCFHCSTLTDTDTCTTSHDTRATKITSHSLTSQELKIERGD